MNPLPIDSCDTWKYELLRKLSEGLKMENTSTEVQNAAPVVVETTEQKETPHDIINVRKKGFTFEEKMNELRKNGSLYEKTIITQLENYIKNMTPNKVISDEQGADYQFGLWSALYNATNTIPREEFKNVWTIVLNYFYQYRDGVFGNKYVFRFAPFWNHSDKLLDAFQRLLNLIILTSDISNIQNGLKKVDLKKTLDEGFSEEARSRILSYYGK